VFDAQVPIALKPFSQKHSGTWHYENSFYFKPQEYYSCDLTNGGNLRSVLKALDNALKENLTKTQEAILIAFTMHLLEDAHQPLHTGTLVRKDCSIDRGGNRYCLREYAKNCVLNLHQLWDSAFDITRKRAFKEQKHQIESGALNLDLEISRILMEGENQLPLVYSVEENRAPSKAYIHEAIPVANKRLELAIKRVARYLKYHYANTRIR